jgi:hypothetical protein
MAFRATNDPNRRHDGAVSSGELLGGENVFRCSSAVRTHTFIACDTPKNGVALACANRKCLFDIHDSTV